MLCKIAKKSNINPYQLTKIQMAVENQFDEAVKSWEAHCEETRFSSNPLDYLNDTAIEAIVKLGRAALPLIKVHLENKPHSMILTTGWLGVVERITGSASEIPEEISGKMQDIRAHLISILE